MRVQVLEERTELWEASENAESPDFDAWMVKVSNFIVLRCRGKELANRVWGAFPGKVSFSRPDLIKDIYRLVIQGVDPEKVQETLQGL